MATPNSKLLNARQAIVNQGGKLKAIPQTEQEKQNVSKSMPMFLQTQPKAKPTPPKGIVATPAPVTTPSPSGPVNQFGVQIDQARQAQEMAQNAMPTLTDEERATALVNQELADAKAKEMELFGESSSVSSLDEMVAKQAEQNKQKKISLEQEIARSEQEKIASDAQARNQAQSQAEAQSVAFASDREGATSAGSLSLQGRVQQLLDERITTLVNSRNRFNTEITDLRNQFNEAKNQGNAQMAQNIQNAIVQKEQEIKQQEIDYINALSAQAQQEQMQNEQIAGTTQAIAETMATYGDIVRVGADANFTLEDGRVINLKEFGFSDALLATAKDVQGQYAEMNTYTASALDKTIQLNNLLQNNGSQEEIDALQIAIQEDQRKALLANQNAVSLLAQSQIKNGVNVQTVLDNIKQFMLPSESQKIDKDISELLGYVADSYGNPMAYDESGMPVEIKKEEDIEWGIFTDQVTGNTIAYNKKNPTQREVLSGGEYFSDSSGTYSSPTTNGKAVAMTPELEALIAQVNPVSLDYAGNCAEFANTFTGANYRGNYSVADRSANIRKAEQNGEGGANLDLVQIGDVIHTSEGNVGHSAVVMDIQGDNLVLLEANYTPGQITYGRTISKNDPKVLGFIRGTNSPQAGEQIDKAFASIEEQMEAKEDWRNYFTDVEVKQFIDNKMPTFYGTDFQKKNQQEEWQKKATLFASMYQQGDITMEDVNPEGYKKELKLLQKDDQFKQLMFLGKLLNSINSYLDGVDRVGMEGSLFGLGLNDKASQEMGNLYRDMLTSWKDWKGLGALTGPDMGLAMGSLPSNEKSLFGGLAGGDIDEGGVKTSGMFFGYSPEELKAVYDRTIKNTIAQESKMLLTNIKEAYPDLANSESIKQIEELVTKASLGLDGVKGMTPQDLQILNDI